MLKLIKRMAGLDVLEEILLSDPQQKGLAFTMKTSEVLGIKGHFINKPQGPFRSTVFLSTHHSGAADFLSTFPYLSEMAPHLKVALNTKILKIRPLEDIAIALNPLSSKKGNSRAAGEMLSHLKSGGNLLIYPAGKVGYLHQGQAQDFEWSATLGKIILKASQQVVPLYVDAKNSDSFYKIRRIFPALSMLYLLRTVTRIRPGAINIYMGSPLLTTEFQGRSPEHFMKEIRRVTYSLKKRSYVEDN